MTMLISAVWLAGCSSRVKKIEETFERLADEFTEEPEAEEPEEIVEEEPEPVEKDAYFDDFLYSFASDQSFRLRRTILPLPCYKYDESLRLDENEWSENNLFDEDNIFTQIYDQEADLELESDTTLNSIQFEWITLSSMEVEKYYFQRLNGIWKLEAVNIRGLDENDNYDFVHFYQQFANDSTFQQQHVHDPLTYITVDPDNEFTIVESFIDADQWLAFRPDIPTLRLSNIYYGQQNSNTSVRKILRITNVVDGYSSVLYFRKVRDDWELYKFEDTSV